MIRDGEVKRRQHFYHKGDIIWHPNSGYVTTKPQGTSAVKHWQFMSNWKDGSTVELFTFRVYISFLPKYRAI